MPKGVSKMQNQNGPGPLRKLTVGILLAMLTPVGIAQIAPIEELVVTGSRIARDPNAAATAPVQSITAEAIRLSGSTEPTDFLRQQPALLTSLSSEASADSGAQGGLFSRVGQSVLALRGMGANRTLVLVDGRRHVAGVEGSQAVDIGTIPSGLIERVETLTGGASSIYGADAVTGVVNFILKDDFEGLDGNVQVNQNEGGDGKSGTFDLLFGQNFSDGRGNVTVAGGVMRRDRVLFGDRRFSRNNRIAESRDNPDRRFQAGEISTATTPSFAQFYSVDQGRFPSGFIIDSSADAFLNNFQSEFGFRPALTPAELALIERRANSTPQIITPFPSFSIANDAGIIAPRNFRLNDFIDLDGNGVHDCLDSHQGFNGMLEPGYDSFGLAGGCWTVDPDGSIRPYRDGLVTSDFNAIGGDGIIDANRIYMTPEEFRWSLNVTARYDLTPSMRAFGEARYVEHETEFGRGVNGFYDLLTVKPDNPFIPSALAGVATQANGLFITRDPTDVGTNLDKNTRETMRFVGGLEGSLGDGMVYEISANYGRFDRKYQDRNSVIQDRYYAAIDVVADPVSGQPICRSDIDSLTRPPTTRFNIPPFTPGFFTFNPGDGQCAPLNLFGLGAASPEAINFVSATTVDEFRLEQLVFSGSLAGELPYFEMPAGKIGFAVGTEFREEKSSQKFDPLKLGIVPVNTPDATAGTRVSELPNRQNNLVFNPRNIFNNASESFDVWEAFGEVRVPLLVDMPFARELTLEASYRYSDYSTIGSTETYAYGLSWAPVDDVRFRGTQSRAVRAPNINELFAPPEAAAFNLNIEPCTQARIQGLIAAGDPAGLIRQANCAAELGPNFVNPLSAGFGGALQGNADLSEEKADTWTFGVVLQPRFLDGLMVTVDYWSIEIDEAIQTISGEDILANCYDSPNWPNNAFCPLFEREKDPTSPQFNGLTFLSVAPINFAAVESAGVDFAANYLFEALGGDLAATINGTWVDRLDFYLDPSDSSVKDPQLTQIQRPEWAGNANLRYRRGEWGVGWTTNYQSSQYLRGVRASNGSELFGGSGKVGSFVSHNASFSYDFMNGSQIYGGVNNVFNKDPFSTERAWPVSGLGRTLFLGLNFSI